MVENVERPRNRKLKEEKDADKYIINIELLYMSDYKGVDRKTLIKWLDGCAYGIEGLYDEMMKKLTIIPEMSRLEEKIKKKKVSKMEASMGKISEDAASDLQQFYTIDELAGECMEKFIENFP